MGGGCQALGDFLGTTVGEGGELSKLLLQLEEMGEKQALAALF